ncbi:PRC-barrel domain-containing protein [Nisaea nitritireducens]|uniref:PRC-barrel domain-containing protein n=1 Tax=Nisaea nitritireducens TaxID=568392 RepID=UPI001865F5BD|nr:PRC-barrel domain-containing protein [Nisaea nitritireducens]
MIRKLLTTTALSATIALGGLVTANAAGTGSAKSTGVFQPHSGAAASKPYLKPQTDQILASALIGKSVYGSTAKDAEPIGDINDVVMTTDGDVLAAVIGVGGVLGIGEKDVAVDINRLQWIPVEDSRRLVADATKDELKKAPAFDRSAFDDYATLGFVAPAMKKIDDGFASLKKQSKDAVNSLTKDDETLVTVDPAKLTTDELIGARVYGANNEDIGEIDKVLRGAGNRVEAYVVDVGGFLGLGEKPVALASGTGRLMQAEDGGEVEVHVPFTLAQLESHPAYSDEEYDTMPDSIILR